MKEQYVSDLIEGARVDSIFALKSKEMRSARTGEVYLSLDLADRTGRIGAVCFRPQGSSVAVPAGSVVHVRGVVTSFRGMKRVSVDALRPTSTYDASDLLPDGPHDPVESVGVLRSLVASVRDPDLRRLLRLVFGDRSFMRRFATCPASQSRHHAYLGGLLDHTIAVASSARRVAAQYEHVDAELLTTAALLHDIGKVDELVYDVSISYSDDGRLLGHVVLGERRVATALASLTPALPSDKAARLSHAILSHHGELEWGAPKRPCTLEALIIHHLDNLDAKVTGFIEATARAAVVEEAWTDAANLFRRPLYAPRAAEDDRPRIPDEDAQYAVASV